MNQYFCCMFNLLSKFHKKTFTAWSDRGTTIFFLKKTKNPLPSPHPFTQNKLSRRFIIMGSCFGRSSLAQIFSVWMLVGRNIILVRRNIIINNGYWVVSYFNTKANNFCENVYESGPMPLNFMPQHKKPCQCCIFHKIQLCSLSYLISCYII